MKMRILPKFLSFIRLKGFMAAHYRKLIFICSPSPPLAKQGHTQRRKKSGVRERERKDKERKREREKQEKWRGGEVEKKERNISNILLCDPEIFEDDLFSSNFQTLKKIIFNLLLVNDQLPLRIPTLC
jgi:hypothetical protein